MTKNAGFKLEVEMTERQRAQIEMMSKRWRVTPDQLVRMLIFESGILPVCK